MGFMRCARVSCCVMCEMCRTKMQKKKHRIQIGIFIEITPNRIGGVHLTMRVSVTYARPAAEAIA